MVVRLKDLNSGNAPSSSGIVRLKDIQQLNQSIDSANRMNQEDIVQTEKLRDLPSLDLTPVQPLQQQSNDFLDQNGFTRGLRDYVLEPVKNVVENSPMLFGLPGKFSDNPVSNAIAEYTVPDAPMIQPRSPGDPLFRDNTNAPGTNARQAFLDRSGQAPATGVPKFIGQVASPFFVPGAQLGTGTQATNAAEGLITRFAPRLQGIGQAAAREGLAGAGIGAATEFAQGQNDPVNAGLNALYGAGLGAAGGAAFKGLGTGLERLRASRAVDNAVQTPAVQDQLRPTLPDNEISQIADEGLNRLAPQSNPDIVNFDPRNPIRLEDATSEANPGFQATHIINNTAHGGGTPVQATIDSKRLNYTSADGKIRGSVPANNSRLVPIEPNTIQVESPQITEPRTSEPRSANRQLIDNTFLGSERATPEVRSRLETSPVRQHERITNQDTVDAATQRIGRGVDNAEAFSLGGKGAVDAEQIATGFRLIDEFQRTGQIQRAVTMAERLAEKLTKAGQTVQAASIWNRLTPEGALISAQRKVNNLNSELPKGAEKIKITEQQANDITQAAQAIQRSGTSAERAGQVVQLMDKARSGQALTDAEKQVVSEFITDAMQFVKPATERTPRVSRQPKEMSDKRVSDNVISFLQKQEAAAKQRLAARRNTLSSTPLDVYADYAIVGASKLAQMGVKGAVKFNDWAIEMVKEYGEEIRPKLNEIYEKAQEVLSSNAKRIRQETISEAEKIADRYLAKNETNLKPEDIQLVQDLAKKVSALSGDAQRLANQDLQQVLNGFEKAGIGKKISSAQYISMLLNPVTQVRNIVGNELMYRLERLNRIASTPIDWATSVITGKERTITFKKGPDLWSNFFSPTQNYWEGLKEGAQAGWRGVNPEGLSTSYDIRGQAFKSKLNPVTYLEKSLGAVMKGFDYAAYNRAVQQRLSENAYLDAINRGIKGRDAIRSHMDKYLTNLDDNIAKIASDYGKYVTLQDKTLLADALSKGQRILNLNKSFGLGSVVLPFAKTPANLLMRAIDYSPLGVLRAISQTYDILRKPNVDLTRADVIQSVTRALLGTGLGAAGLWLADKGVLRGESSKDKDTRELEKSAGLGQYQLNASALQRMLGALVTGKLQDVDAAAKIQPGDQLYQYEWAQPTSIPLAVGANIVQERQKAANQIKQGKKPSESAIGQAFNVTSGALNTLFNTSVLRGLQQAFDIPPGEDNIPKAIGTNVVKSIPSMFTPSIVSKINQYGDSAVRETYGPSFTEKVLNPAQSRLPGLAQQLPQKVDVLGKPQTKENNFFDVFLSPAQRNEFKPTKEAQIVFDLLNRTGEEKVVPRAVDKYITGKDPNDLKKTKRVDLTPEQLTKYQKIVGEETAKGLGKLKGNLSDDKKVKAVIGILNDAGEKGRKEMRKELGLK